jgi:hypothetical protein
MWPAAAQEDEASSSIHSMTVAPWWPCTAMTDSMSGHTAVAG